MKDKDLKDKSIKQQLIDQINGIKDEVFLQALQVLVALKIQSESKPISKAKPETGRYELSTFEHVKLRPALKHYQTGDHSPHEKVKQDIDAWLKSE